MRRKVKIIFLVVIGLLFLPKISYALSYKIKELVPIRSSISINTNHFGYKEMKYENDRITFSYIKNLTNEEIPVSISIGLFDKNGKNINTFNICNNSQTLLPKEKKAFKIENVSTFLTGKKTAKDIYYLAILSDNFSCRTHGIDDYVGLKVEEIGKINRNTGTEVNLFIKILIGVGLLIFVPLIYKFAFTNDFKNMDGNDVRKVYFAWQKQQNRKPKKRLSIRLKKKNKSDEILEQEEKAKQEKTNETDLHNIYKKE